MTGSKHKISASEIKERRQRLKKERSARHREMFFRFVVILGASVGVFWWITLPQWVLDSAEQINVNGNELLSDDEIRQLIPLEYPQPILTLSGDKLAQDLNQKAPLQDITVIKQILPPSVTIEVREKQPVALAFGAITGENGQVSTGHIGYINSEGIFVDNQMYQNLQTEQEKLPQLKVFGNPVLYLPYWENLYDLISQSVVPITEINWENPNNIILTTDLGKIHLGAYTSKLPEQLTALAQLRPITEQIRREDIIYIDLLDPYRPLIKERKP